MSTKTYKLTVDAAQLAIIQRACEALARMSAWQFRIAFEALEFTSENGKIDCLSINQCSEIEKAITAIIPMPERFKKTESELLAWGIHKVIMHQRHIESGSTGWNVNSSLPINTSNKSKLIKIEALL